MNPSGQESEACLPGAVGLSGAAHNAKSVFVHYDHYDQASLQPAQIIRHAAKSAEQLSVAEYSDHGFAGAAERDRADVAGSPRQNFRAS